MSVGEDDRGAREEKGDRAKDDRAVGADIPQVDNRNILGVVKVGSGQAMGSRLEDREPGPLGVGSSLSG
ncbi:MAG: hypothetical protein AAFY26_23905 [Cyanobacteria bacterium J06638_22]